MDVDEGIEDTFEIAKKEDLLAGDIVFYRVHGNRSYKQKGVVQKVVADEDRMIPFYVNINLENGSMLPVVGGS